MRIKVASGMVCLLALVASVVAAPAQQPSFLGEWTATAETPGCGVRRHIHGYGGPGRARSGTLHRRPHHTLRPHE